MAPSSHKGARKQSWKYWKVALMTTTKFAKIIIIMVPIYQELLHYKCFPGVESFSPCEADMLMIAMVQAGNRSRKAVD